MSRRKYYRRMPCAVQPCKEYANWEFDRRDEYDRHAKSVTTWKCVRHEHPEELLSPTNMRTEWVSEPSAPSERYPGKDLYFKSSGFVYGSGYRVFADDFPLGTRIRVVAEVILPGVKEREDA